MQAAAGEQALGIFFYVVGDELVDFAAEADYLRCDVVDEGGALDSGGVEMFQECIGGAGEFYDLIGDGRAIENRIDSFHQGGRGIYGRDGHAKIFDVPIRALHRDSYSGEGVINGAANAQLAVDAAISGRRLRQNDARYQFVWLQLAIVVTFSGVEIVQRNAASGGGAGNFDFCIQA